MRMFIGTPSAALIRSVIPEQLNGINPVPSMQWSIILQRKAMSPLWQSKRVLPALQKDVRCQRFQVSYEFGPDRFTNHRLWRNDSALALSWNSPRHHCSCVSGQRSVLSRLQETDLGKKTNINTQCISKQKRADGRYSVRAGWVTVEVIDLALALPLSQSLEDNLKDFVDVNRAM